jgi:hypothetical protein
MVQDKIQRRICCINAGWPRSHGPGAMNPTNEERPAISEAHEGARAACSQRTKTVLHLTEAAAAQHLSVTQLQKLTLHYYCIVTPTFTARAPACTLCSSYTVCICATWKFHENTLPYCSTKKRQQSTQNKSRFDCLVDHDCVGKYISQFCNRKGP